MKSVRMAKVILVADFVWIAVLLLLLAGFWQGWPGFALVRQHSPVGGVLPVWIPWAGMLGGVTISLVGAVEHSRDWDPRWNLWHVARPVLGGIAGSVAFVIVVVVLRTAGGLSDTASALPSDFLARGLFFVLAFVAGFRDKMFLELVAKVAKVIFSNGDAASEEGGGFLVEADTLDFGAVPVGTASAGQEIRVVFGAIDTSQDLADGWASSTDEQFDVESLPREDGSRVRRVVVTFTPLAQGEVKGELLLASGSTTRRVSLAGRGT